MLTAGVRQLRHETRELLRLVQQGETIEITDRGRPVALLIPLPDDGPLQRLRVSGHVDESDGDLDRVARTAGVAIRHRVPIGSARSPATLRPLMRVAYLDSSAVVKLAVAEPESRALRSYLLRRQYLVASALIRTEVLRALLPGGAEAVARGREVIRRLNLVRMNDRVLDAPAF